MSIMDSVKGWLLGVALGKGVKSLAKLIVSYCMAKGISIVSVVAGISINTNDVLVMTAAINTALKSLFSYAKEKWPGKFDWLP